MKRTDYISWDEYFMGIALLSSQRSKDPGTQVGACIVSPEKRILTVGYNGMPVAAPTTISRGSVPETRLKRNICLSVTRK